MKKNWKKILAAAGLGMMLMGYFSDSGDGFCGGRYAESADFCK